jgi:hypothetical protein
MNANELADELDKYKGIATRDAATMLRQQQAEIEAMRTRIEYMREKASLWEAEAHAGGFGAGVKSAMSEHCTCYKLGYSQLNDYAKVKAK